MTGRRPIFRSGKGLTAVVVVAGTVAFPRTAASPQGTVWEILPSGTSASLRGLSVVDDSIAWASGTRGTVIRTLDGGNTWIADSIPGAGSMDLRAVSARSVLVAHAAATAGRIWRTTDGGRSWSLRYQAADTGVFLDALVFTDDSNGVALGDPIGGRFLVLVTRDVAVREGEARPLDELLRGVLEAEGEEQQHDADLAGQLEEVG